jgi:hypothetical protein
MNKENYVKIIKRPTTKKEEFETELLNVLNEIADILNNIQYDLEQMHK